MATLKNILFARYAGKALESLVIEMQKKYSEKKGRRFNHDNITYEISRANVIDENIQFEISSKIPQDELKGDGHMKNYFKEIKKLVTSLKLKPFSVEMENIVLDTNKKTEKERDYVKLLYRYPVDDLYSDKEISEKIKTMNSEEDKKALQEIKGALTPQGSIALQLVLESTKSFARKNIEQLIDANKQVKAKMAT
tara:strand:+ start:92 stop:676 length:585 start_codon:yes stop_codon:yes gene_type:complete